MVLDGCLLLHDGLLLVLLLILAAVVGCCCGFKSLWTLDAWGGRH
jgi:hypothetical protein